MGAFWVLLIGVTFQVVGSERAAAGAAVTSIEVRQRGSFSARRGHAAKLSTRSSGSSALLATAEGVAGRSESAAATSSFARLHQALTVSSHMIPGEGGRGMMKMMMGCACLLILFKLVSSIDCYSKRLDCRRCRLIARFLLWAGWDEFEGFRATVSVHSVADIVNTGMLGGEKSFKVKVAFKWSQFVTSSTKDMKWNQTKGTDVPQGADECVISLYSEGKIKDSLLGEYVLETKRDMLDAKKFWGEKKKLKLENKGKLVGTIIITFRNQDDDGAGGGSSDLPIEGVDEDSALAIAVREAYDEMIKDGVVQRPERKPSPANAEGDAEGGAPQEEEVVMLEGHQKIDCLGRCITGYLREVDKNGKEAGKVFIRVIRCNFAELQGDQMKEEMANQWKKAQDKGLQELPKKWYWVWYEDKKAAYNDRKWHEPDGYIPMTAISKINRQPERNDQFVVSYSDDGEKHKLVYRRDGGTSLDVWIEGLDMCFNATRQIVKDEKDAEERGAKGKGKGLRQL